MTMNWLTQKVFLTFCFFFLLLAAMTGCRSKQSDDDTNEQQVKAVVAVKTDRVAEHDAVLSVSALGRTDALRKEKIYSPIAGKIIAMKVYEGTEVKKGDVVAVIQSKESNAAIMGAEGMVQSAATPERKAEAGQVLKLAQSTQNSVNVVAKFNGIVSTRSASEGELVVENGELLTIIDLSTVDFAADVTIHDLLSVKIGQLSDVRFQSIPGKVFPAIVDAINPQTDVQSQTIKVRLRFLRLENNGEPLLRTDIIGTATIVTGMRRHALFVPKTAILRDDEKNLYSIVTLTADSLAKTVPVLIGTATDSSVEVSGEGVRAGMPVITEGNYSLADSTRVTVARQD
jgi:multidrug efflux pump subunit AcrA (membrane-fusion protein)